MSGENYIKIAVVNGFNLIETIYDNFTYIKYNQLNSNYIKEVIK